jgi:hypothetical protein
MPIAPATTSQWNYYQALAAKAYADNASGQAEALIRGLAMTKAEMSTAIDSLVFKASNTKPAAVMPSYIPPMGSYLAGGHTYKLKLSKYKTSTQLFKDGVYFGTVGFAKANVIINSYLDTPAKAHAAVIEFAKVTGKCGVCHKTLTDPESIAKGIGPKCEKAYKF